MSKVWGAAAKILIGLWLGLALLVAPVSAAEHHGQVVFNGFGVPGVAVTASHGDQKYSAITDTQGGYSFSDLADGVWNIQVEMQAFSSIRQDVTVGPDAAAGQWELKVLPMDQIQGLQAAPPSPPASATAPAPASSAKNANTKKNAAPAPTNTQTPFQRMEVNATGAAASAAPVMEAASATPGAETLGGQADLAQQAADGFLIRGSENNSASSALAQARAFGNNRGGRSPYSGSVTFNIDNSALNARSYSLAGIDTPEPAYSRTQTGLSFGGPLRISNHGISGTRFYVGYNSTRNRNVQTQSGLVPTQAERNGDLSQTGGQIFDPANNRPFTNNQIPDDRISRQARSLLNLYPLPNFTGNVQYNYQVPVVSSTHSDGVNINLNKAFDGIKSILSGTFSLYSSRGDNPTLFGFLDSSRSRYSNLSVTYRRSITPRFGIVSDFKFTRQSSRSISFFGNRENISGAAGITGNNQDSVNWGPPTISFFSSGLSSLSDAVPSSNHNQTSTLAITAYWTRGKHNASFGTEYRRQQDNRLSQQNPRGSFTFTGASTLGALSGFSFPGARNDFAGFLLGIPDAVSIAFGNADKYFRSSSYNAFVADDWRVNRGFTLNVGLRWEYASPITELYGRLVNLDIAPGFAAVAPVVANHPVGSLTATNYPDSLVHPNKRAFQPRIGWSWKPIASSSMVVRGGYGMYYNSSPYESIANEMMQQSPLSKSLSLQNTIANPLTLANGFTAPPNTTTNTFAVDPNLRIGYVHIWQLSIQVDLPGALQLTATYQGTRGKNALQEILPNTYPAGAVNPCPSCPSGFKYMTSNGSSNREAGIFQLRRRLHNGLSATIQYTFSKSIDDAMPGTSGTSSAIAQDWRNPGAERALSNFNQSHVGKFEFQYTTGMGVKGGTLMKGWKGALYKEWTLSSSIDAGSGLPQSPIFPSTVRGTGVTGPVRPDCTGADIYAAPPGLHLNPAAFKAPTPGYWGNAGRNSIIGPAQFTMNASLSRVFRTSDRTSLNLTVNANNALNHVTFRSWTVIVGSTQFGLPSAANSMRSLQTNIRWSF
jgi:trimeric autotransporter adhesin